jgi:aspartate aminotransferase
MKLSSRLARVGASPTLSIDAKAKALRREGRDIVAFGAGEPDFDTPEVIKEAARVALREGKTKYSPPAGEVELRAALKKQYAERWSLDYDIEEILVSCGAKHSLYNLFTALLDEGDEVIVPSPYWVSYPAQVLLAGGNPVTVEAGPETNFFPTLEALDRAVTPRTRAVVINSPSNPTGAVLTKAQLDELAQWLLAHPDIIAVYDGIYENLIYEGAEYYELAALAPGLREQVVCINGVAKSYAMTGWRIGWALGPKPLIKAMSKLQSQSTSGPTTMAQWATIAAIEMDPGVVQAMVRSYDERAHERAPRGDTGRVAAPTQGRLLRVPRLLGVPRRACRRRRARRRPRPGRIPPR